MAGPDQTGWVKILQAQAARLGISHRIHWPGMLQGDMKWGAYHAAEVFCLPSHQEHSGIVVAESMACGKPVLISNKVNIWREIEADKAGFIDEDSVDGTVRNLHRWLALSANDYDQMAGRARQSFASRFHIDRAAARLLDRETRMTHAPQDQTVFIDLSRFQVERGFRERLGLRQIKLWWLVRAICAYPPFAAIPVWLAAGFLWRSFGADIGDNVQIRPTARVTFPWKVKIGARSWIGDFADSISRPNRDW